MLCPQCESLLDDRWRCANGHHFPLRDGVPSVIDDVLRARLEPFLDAFNDFRARHRQGYLDPKIYAGLPSSGLVHDRSIWYPRLVDLRLLDRIIGNRTRLYVLDVGAWNGWLSHQLARRGHRVLALDYFTDPHDGLGAVRHYPLRFDAVQFDLERLDLLDERFDLVIADRCMAYFVDITRSVEQMKRLLAPGGTLLLTGLNVYKDTRAIAAYFKASDERFREAYGMPYLFKSVRGYLAAADVRRLTLHGIGIRSYGTFRLRNMLTFLRPSAPRYLYGIHRAPIAP